MTIAASGCGDDGAPAPRVIDASELSTCDITTSACQRGIYNSVAEMLEASGYRMPSIRTISVDQHADEVRSAIDLEDLTGEDPESRGLRLLGFIPEASESLTATQVEYWITRVAAYYTRSNNGITVIDRDYEVGSAQILLAHELIHSIQHSQFNLGTVSAGATTEDGEIGVRSVIEGDAVFSSLAWYAEVSGSDPATLDWAADFEESTSRLRARAADPETAMIDTASSFPYAYGYQYFATAVLAEGLPARTALFEAPPFSTAEVLAGYGETPPVLDIPDAAHPAPLVSDMPEVRNRVGAWYVYAVLRRQGIEHEEAWAAALSWVGDELAIYEEGDEVVAVWRVRFDDAVSAESLSEQVNAGAGGVARSAVAFGDDAFVFAAETTDTLLAWVAQPLDEMTASIVLKNAPIHAGPISVGTCSLSHDFLEIDFERLLR